MSIKTKAFLIVFLLLVALGGADFAIQRYIIFPSFLELEQQQAGENLRRIFYAIDREVVHLDMLCRDWAVWDDSYQFMRSPSKKFISANLNDETINSDQLSLLAYVNLKGTVTWSRGFDHVAHQDIPFAAISNGTIALDHPFLESLREQTRIPFDAVYPFNTAEILCNAPNKTEFHSDKLVYYMQSEGEYIRTCSSYQDIHGQALFGVQYKFPSDITRKGITSIRYALIVFSAAGLLVLLLISVLLQLVVVRPLWHLNNHAARLRKDGDYSLRLNLKRSDEIGMLAASFDNMVRTISDRTTQLKQANERLTQLSMQDGLTGISNRRTFNSYFEQEYWRAMREKEPLSLILADVDHFKKFNDQYGHLQGDQCLQTIARVLQQNVKRHTDLVARYGGEEFVIVLPNTDKDGALAIAEHFRQTVADLAIPNESSECCSIVTLSLGVASTIPDQRSQDGAESLLELADQALYLAKNNGRNQIQSSDDVPRGACIIGEPEN